MAAKTYYMLNTTVDGWKELSETGPGALATSSPLQGWTPGTSAAGNYSQFRVNVESSAFNTTARPDGSINTLDKDCARTPLLNGSFAAGNWVFTGTFLAVTNASGQDGRLGLRLFKGPNADSTGATEITSAAQVGTTITDLLTTVDQNSTITFNPGAITLNNEYLFVQLGWEVTGAATNANADVLFRIGDAGTNMTTPDFTTTASGSPLFDAANF